MNNQWLTLDKAAAISGKSPSTLRKKTYKKLIKSDYVNQKLVIDKQSLIDFYKLTIEDKQSEPVNQANTGYQTDNQTANHELANRYDKLKLEHNQVKEKLINEKMELAEKLVNIKKQHLEDFTQYDDIIVQKNETIERKGEKIHQQNKVILILLFLTFLAISSLALL